MFHDCVPCPRACCRYFTPSSFDRKGARVFLTDRFKRLGIPFVVVLFVLMPGINAVTNLLLSPKRAGDEASWSYSPDPGPAWFLFWLMLISYAYSSLGGPKATMARPSLLSMVGYGGVLCGLVQLGCIVVLGPQFITMPISFGSLPFDLLFFAAP